MQIKLNLMFNVLLAVSKGALFGHLKLKTYCNLKLKKGRTLASAQAKKLDQGIIIIGNRRRVSEKIFEYAGGARDFDLQNWG